MAKIKLGSVNDVKEGQGKVVNVKERKFALFKKGGKFYVMDNTCLHRGGPIGKGKLNGGIVTCPWHGWQYDITTGECKTTQGMKLKTYPVTVKGEDIFIDA